MPSQLLVYQCLRERIILHFLHLKMNFSCHVVDEWKRGIANLAVCTASLLKNLGREKSRNIPFVTVAVLGGGVGRGIIPLGSLKHIKKIIGELD